MTTGVTIPEGQDLSRKANKGRGSNNPSPRETKTKEVPRGVRGKYETDSLFSHDVLKAFDTLNKSIVDLNKTVGKSNASSRGSSSSSEFPHEDNPWQSRSPSESGRRSSQKINIKDLVKSLQTQHTQNKGVLQDKDYLKFIKVNNKEQTKAIKKENKIYSKKLAKAEKNLVKDVMKFSKKTKMSLSDSAKALEVDERLLNTALENQKTRKENSGMKKISRKVDDVKSGIVKIAENNNNADAIRNAILGPMSLLVSPIEDFIGGSLFEGILHPKKKDVFKEKPSRQDVKKTGDMGSLYLVDMLGKEKDNKKKEPGKNPLDSLLQGGLEALLTKLVPFLLASFLPLLIAGGLLALIIGSATAEEKKMKDRWNDLPEDKRKELEAKGFNYKSAGSYENVDTVVKGAEGKARESETKNWGVIAPADTATIKAVNPVIQQKQAEQNAMAGDAFKKGNWWRVDKDKDGKNLYSFSSDKQNWTSFGTLNSTQAEKLLANIPGSYEDKDSLMPGADATDNVYKWLTMAHTKTYRKDTGMDNQSHNFAKFASGGIVGGNSIYGDKIPSRLNSGEMVINRQQQANLFKSIDSNNFSSPEVPRLLASIDSHTAGTEQTLTDEISPSSRDSGMGNSTISNEKLDTMINILQQIAKKELKVEVPPQSMAHLETMMNGGGLF